MNDRSHDSRLVTPLLVTVLALLALRLIPLPLEQILVVVFTAILIACSVAPVAAVMERRGLPRGVTVLLVYLIVLLVLAGVVALIVPLVGSEVLLLRDRFPQYSDQLRELLAGVAPDLANRFAGSSVGDVAASGASGLLPRLPGFAISFSSVLVRVVIVLVLAYFMAVEERFAERVMRRFTPPQHRARVGRMLTTVGTQLGHWGRAQIVLAVSFGFAFGLGLKLLGVPYAVTLGVVGGVIEVIPYIGGFITVILAVLVASTQSWLIVAGVVVWYTVVVQAQAHILAPKLMERALGLHPLVVVLALFVGAESLGVLGALLAVPLAVVLQVLLDEFYAASADEEPSPSE